MRVGRLLLLRCAEMIGHVWRVMLERFFLVSQSEGSRVGRRRSFS